MRLVMENIPFLSLIFLRGNPKSKVILDEMKTMNISDGKEGGRSDEWV